MRSAVSSVGVVAPDATLLTCDLDIPDSLAMSAWLMPRRSAWAMAFLNFAAMLCGSFLLIGSILPCDGFIAAVGICFDCVRFQRVHHFRLLEAHRSAVPIRPQRPVPDSASDGLGADLEESLYVLRA